MKNRPLKKLSSLYKEQGVPPDTTLVTGQTLPTSAFEIAKRISGRKNPREVFSRTELTAIVDNRLDDAAFRLLNLIKALGWNGPFYCSINEFATALTCSRRHIIRRSQVLESLGFIRIRRGRNSINRYSLAPVSKKASESLDRCSKCGAERPVGDRGICTPCLKQNEADKWAERTLDQRGPMDWEVFCTIAKTDLTLHASRRQLHGAYIRAVDRKATA